MEASHFYRHLIQHASAGLRTNLILRKAQGHEVLTERECGIVALVCDCYSSKEIANILSLSVKTVEAHRANIMRKLRLHDTTVLIRWAIRHGVVAP